MRNKKRSSGSEQMLVKEGLQMFDNSFLAAGNHQYWNCWLCEKDNTVETELKDSLGNVVRHDGTCGWEYFVNQPVHPSLNCWDK